MNIPENILQQVADEAFEEQNIIYLARDPINSECPADCRRAVIQHAISNPALAPFLAGGGEYTDMEIADAWRSANHTMPFVSEIKRFLAALPRRESPSIAEAEPAAQVPLGPEDCPPGSALRSAEGHWFNPTYATTEGVATTTQLETRFIVWTILMNEGWQINTSIPNSGRWDANAWKPCSKPGKEVAK